MNKETGGPAFPQAYQHTEVVAKMYETGELTAEQLKQASSQLAGMTLRDYFAAQALTGAQIWDAVINGKNAQFTNGVKDLAETAYAVADAMLKAREA